MSAILAIYNRNGQPVDVGLLEEMLGAAPERTRDGQDCWFHGPVALAHQHFWVTPEERGECQPIVSADGQCVLVCDARLDNRTELVAALGLDAADGRHLSDAALILAAYARWSTDCVHHLLGDLVFALWDSAEQHLFVATDALGARTVCYHLTNQRCIVASELLSILAHPAVVPRINEGRLAEYLANEHDNPEESFYEGILYLPPGHCLLIRAGAVKKWRYWEVNPQRRIRYRRDEEYAEHYLRLLREAVRCRLRSIGPVGISLSGGLDSTSLAGLAAPLLRERPGEPRLKSFSYTFDELKRCDEGSYIRPVVERYDLDATDVPCDALWTLRDQPPWPVERDYVWSDAHAGLPEAVRQAAQAAGCRVLLAGYFGNQLFEGGAFWAEDMLREFRWRELAGTLAQPRFGPGDRLGVLVHIARTLAPSRLKRAYRRLRPSNNAGLPPGLHPCLVERTHLLERMAGRAQAVKDWRPELAQRYRSLGLPSFSQGGVATRRFYNRCGLDLVNPYHDRRLVEFVMAVPADQLGRPHRDRWVHRNAVGPLLPPAVGERAVGTSFVPLMTMGLRDRERNKVQALLHQPQIVSRGMIRAAWLDEAARKGFVGGDQDYWLWLCVCLELWLRRYWPLGVA